MKNWEKMSWRAGMVAAIFTFTIVLNLFPVSFAKAQEEKPKQETVKEEETRKEYELEIITVTAEKRKENIQEVPVSISALSDIQIEDAGIVDIEDVIYQIPNLHMMKTGSHGSQTTLFMRGIMSIGEPTVGFYVDDVYYSGGFDTELLDVERIEVLRGPQGTLYGRNTEAGVINIVTKKPGNQWEGKASASYGNYNSQNYSAAISGPLVQDKLFFRVSGKYFLSDGYFDNTFLDNDDADDRDDLNGRAVLRWAPTEDLDITLSNEYRRYRDGYACFAPLDEVRRNPHDVSLDFEGSADQDVNGQTLRLVYDREWFTLTSITSLRDWKSDEALDLDFSPVDFMRQQILYEYDTFSQEVRIASPEGSGPFRWLGGGYFFDEKKDTEFTFDYRQGYPAWGIPPFKSYLNNVLDTKGYAFFGQATYTLFKKLDLTAGLRYDNEEKDFTFDGYYDQDLSPWGMLPKKVKADENFAEWLPKFSIDYRFSPDFMIYASAARGYKSGGFNSYVASTAGTPYDPEYTWNYEVGIKSAWLDKRLIFNLSAFYIDWKDQQVLLQSGPTEVTVKNAAESTSKGFELEVKARPITGLQFSAGFGYTDVEFDDYKDSIFDLDPTSPTYGQKIGEADYSGKKNTYVPEYTYNLAVQYRHTNGLFARIGLQGIGDSYYDLANTEKENAYELVNARLGYEMKNFEIYLWAKNLFDEEYATRAFDYGGYYVGRAGDPRTFGITLNGRF
jgi:iron complex outermembrane receptor protein